jgi:hypothetical protein
LDHLQTELFNKTLDTPAIRCQNEVEVFGEKLSIVTPDPKGASSYSEALMQNLGTTYTANDRLAVFPQEQNQVKNSVSSSPLSPFLQSQSLTQPRFGLVRTVENGEEVYILYSGGTL